MKFYPIQFSTEMVQAIPDDRKTKTRRTKGLKAINEFPDEWEFIGEILGNYKQRSAQVFRFQHKEDRDIVDIPCPYGQSGDVLWVRETWNKCDGIPYYKSDYKSLPDYIKNGIKSGHFSFEDCEWKPSIYMPKAACRLFLKIKSICVERLQDITGDDILCEGVDNGKSNKAMGVRWENMQRIAFEELWNKINGQESWKANPYVWVIEFERIEKPKNFC